MWLRGGEGVKKEEEMGEEKMSEKGAIDGGRRRGEGGEERGIQCVVVV